MTKEEVDAKFDEYREAKRRVDTLFVELTEMCAELEKKNPLFLIGRTYRRETMQRVVIAGVDIQPRPFDNANSFNRTYYGNVIKKDGTLGRRVQLYPFYKWELEEKTVDTAEEIK